MDRGGVVSFPSSNPYLVLSWEKLFFKLTKLMYTLNVHNYIKCNYVNWFVLKGYCNSLVSAVILSQDSGGPKSSLPK